MHFLYRRQNISFDKTGCKYSIQIKIRNFKLRDLTLGNVVWGEERGSRHTSSHYIIWLICYVVLK